MESGLTWIEIPPSRESSCATVKETADLFTNPAPTTLTARVPLLYIVAWGPSSFNLR